MPANALVVDCSRADGQSCWSHWPGAPAVPRILADDTSTGHVIRAAGLTPSPLSGFSLVVNDHIDADGLLAMAAACHPHVAVHHADLVRGAAEAGDFTAWTGEAPFRLMLCLHQLIRAVKTDGPGWEQRAVDQATADLQALVSTAAEPQDERDALVSSVLGTRRRITDGDGFAAERLGTLATLRWRRSRGHAWDQFNGLPLEDDLPLWALSGLWEDHLFQLLGEETGSGTIYALDAPRHSWARTVRRPLVVMPDLDRTRLRLTAVETAGCRWVTGEDARRIGFVCRLACVDAAGHPAPSALPMATVAAAVREALRSRP